MDFQSKTAAVSDTDSSVMRSPAVRKSETPQRILESPRVTGVSQLQEMIRGSSRVREQRKSQEVIRTGKQPVAQKKTPGEEMDESEIRVHFDSDKPAQLRAVAVAYANEMHVKSGEEPAMNAWSNGVAQLAAAAPSSANAATYDAANIDATAGVNASTSVEVKTTRGNHNPGGSSPVEPVNADYMDGGYQGDFEESDDTTTLDDNGDDAAETYVPTEWDADFNLDRNKGHTLTKTHIIHHDLASNANDNGHNIVWANAYLNNSTWFPSNPKPRSVADREHEDRATLRSEQFGASGQRKLTDLYGGKNVRAYNGVWYTDDNSIPLPLSKVPGTDIPTIAANTFPGNSNIWKLNSGSYCMWYKSVPIYKAGYDYGARIRKIIYDGYDDMRIDPQHTEEDLDDPNWFDDVGDEVKNSYTQAFQITSKFYELSFASAVGKPIRSDVSLGSIVVWSEAGSRDERINDPSPLSGGMQVSFTYAEAMPAEMSDDDDDAMSIERSPEIKKSNHYIEGWG